MLKTTTPLHHDNYVIVIIIVMHRHRALIFSSENVKINFNLMLTEGHLFNHNYAVFLSLRSCQTAVMEREKGRGKEI